MKAAGGFSIGDQTTKDAAGNYVFERTADGAKFSIKINNNSGSTLPSTGGIGTTIFYVAGSILVLAAAILLITKRRMGAGE